MRYFIIDGINPLPWMAPKLGVARSRAGHYPVAYPAAEMTVYQESIKDYMRERYPDQALSTGENFITFWYWRSLNFGGQRRQRCDATNLNKCLEDALQGILYENDKRNRVVVGVIVSQERDIEPRIVIRLEPITALPPQYEPPLVLHEDSEVVSTWTEEELN
jgi:Holliday junction resolvase RusA-like endonuclease